MKIEFENIKSGERISFDQIRDPNLRSAQIDAYVNSSNMGVNANKGQDFAWRLSPEVKAEFDAIRGDYNRLNNISGVINVAPEDITDGQILGYMVSEQLRQDQVKSARTEDVSSYEDQYQRRVAAAKQRKATPTDVKEKPVVKPATKK